MDEREQKIRARAHQLWLDAGKPDGQEVSHWEQANSEIDTTETLEGDTAADTSPLDGAPRLAEPASVPRAD